jgi:3-oxoacyl-[acyl-carrier protein] reductase
MELYLKGKTAVVTGGSQGIGRAIVKALAIEGVKVLVTARNEDLLASLKDEVVAAGGVEPVSHVQDFLAVDGPKNIAAAALAGLGSVDLLVNNTGRSRAMGVVGSEEDWEAAMMLDFDRHRQLTQQLLPHFMERRQGAVLNMTSTYELRSINGSAVAKAAVAVWSKQLAGQLGQYGIRVNCLQPGLIDTENVRGIFSAEERRQFAEREIPLGDFGEPEDIADMAAFLLSPRARYITGSVAVVDGGMRRHPF